MTNLTFWGSKGDSLELMAEKLNQSNSDRLGNQLFNEIGYIEPLVENRGGIPALASVCYQQQGEKPISGKLLKRVQAIKRFQIFTATSTGDSLVGLCFFMPISRRFKELYLVASKQEFVGIYMDGEQIAEMAKSNPVIVPDMMRPYLLGIPRGDLEAFCCEMTEAAKKFLGGVKTFEL